MTLCESGFRPETPDEILKSFQFGKKAFFAVACTIWRPRHFRIAQRPTERWRKSRACAEAYIGTPHKKTRRLIPPWRDQGGKGHFPDGYESSLIWPKQRPFWHGYEGAPLSF